MSVKISSFLVVCAVLFLARTALGSDVGPVGRECRDTFHSCLSWSKAGMCDNSKFGFVMRGGCAKTCGFCTGKENIPKKKLNISMSDIHSIVAQNKKQTKVDQVKTIGQHKQKSTKLDESSTNTGSAATASPPTILTTHTTITTATTATTPTTATTAAPARDLHVVVDVDKPGENADHPDNGKCKDVFQRCKLWNEETSICERSAFKFFMKYGCKKTCSLCGSSSESQRKAVIETSPESLSSAAKKSLFKMNLDNDDENDELMNAVEVGIAKEINEEVISKSSKRDKLLPKVVSKKRKKASKRGKALTHKHSKRVHGVKGKRHVKKSKIRRVEIENGYKHPRPFESYEEGHDAQLSPDQQNSEAVNTFGRALNSADGFDSLAKLPDFDGVNDVGDVQKLLETPKPNKKLDYYVEHFSKDPYVAYSEKQDWMTENDLHLKKFRRRLQKVPKSSKRSSKKRTNTSKKQKRDLKTTLKSNKKVKIENGLKDDPSLFATAEEIANGMEKSNFHMAGANSDEENPIFPDSQSLKPDFVSQLRQLPYFEGLDNDDAEKTLAKAKLGKNFDYYVESFSKDPYLAESEREQWMTENEVRPKSIEERT